MKKDKSTPSREALYKKMYLMLKELVEQSTVRLSQSTEEQIKRAERIVKKFGEMG